MHVLANRWLPLAVSTSVTLALWALAAAHGYGWQMLWLPAAVAGAAWPRHRKRPQPLPPARVPKAWPGSMTIRLVLAVASALVLGAGCTADETGKARPAVIPTAASSTLHGRIAYSTPSGDIWVMDADGTGRRRITNPGSGHDFDPDLSPDGRKIVFRTSRGHYAPDPHGIGLEGIFVVDVHTLRERQIQPRTGGLFPAWSPNGKRIAFSGLPREGRLIDTVHVMNPDGSGVRDLGHFGEAPPGHPKARRSCTARTRATATGRCG
jgi:hypothetical protein